MMKQCKKKNIFKGWNKFFSVIRKILPYQVQGGVKRAIYFIDYNTPLVQANIAHGAGLFLPETPYWYVPNDNVT